MDKLKRTLSQLVPILLILFLIALTFIYAMFQGGFVSWFLFYSFAPFGCYSLAIMMYPLHRLKVQRELNKHVYQAGDEFTVTIKITRKGYLPILYMLIQDELPPHLETYYGKNASKIMIFPFFRKEIQVQYSLFGLPRGEHSFKEIRLQIGDFFGFATKEASYKREEAYLVYPKITKVEIPSAIFTEYEQGELSSLSAIRHGGGFVSGVREYQAGDQFSWIDWKASARKNVLVSKEFEQQRTSRLMIVMDGSSRYGLEPRITFAASILSACAKMGEEVQFISLGENIFMQPVQNSQDHLYKVLSYLAVMQGENMNRFPELLNQQQSKWQMKGNILLIVTEVKEALMFTIEAYMERGCHVCTVMVLQGEQRLNEQEQSFIRLLDSKRVQVKVITESDLLDKIK